MGLARLTLDVTRWSLWSTRASVGIC